MPERRDGTKKNIKKTVHQLGVGAGPRERRALIYIYVLFFKGGDRGLLTAGKG